MNTSSFSLKCSAERISKFLVTFSAEQNTSITLSLTHLFSFYLISIGIFHSRKCYRCRCVVHETQVSYPCLCSANIWLYKLKLDSSYRRLGMEEYFNDSQKFVVHFACVHYPSNCKLLLRLLGISPVQLTRSLHLMHENCVPRMTCRYYFIRFRLAESLILPVCRSQLSASDGDKPSLLSSYA